jgi:AbrB family looped-hinge helix DNA binding protein
MRTKVSPKAQVSIPAAIRREFRIKPETQPEWVVKGGLITVIPVTDDPVHSFRGRGKGIYATSRLVVDRKIERKEEDGTTAR